MINTINMNTSSSPYLNSTAMPSPQDREIRKLVFGFIVLLVVVVILALTILINLATHDH